MNLMKLLLGAALAVAVTFAGITAAQARLLRCPDDYHPRGDGDARSREQGSLHEEGQAEGGCGRDGV